MATPAPAPTPRPAPVPTPAPGSRPPGVPATQPAAKVSRLGNIKRGLLREAKRFFFYGPEGVGKSTLAADAPRPVFMDTDRGSGHINLERYPFRDGPEGHIAESLDEVYAGIDDLLVAKHDYQSLVIDTADSLEALIWKKVCDRAGVTKKGDVIENIEDFGYGKGYNVAADEWRVLLDRLDRLRLRRGMHIIFVGHLLVKTFKNPIGEDFDRYRPKLDDRALGLLREWNEVVGLIMFDDIAKKATKNTRARGVSTGIRVIQLEHNAAWDAKSRLPLPAQIYLELQNPWAPFAAALDALYEADPAALRTQIEAELVRLGDTFIRADGGESKAEAVRAAAAATDDPSTLTKYLTALKQAQTKESQS